ncbi:MAG: FliM/FliN family flagellar motor switch protein [Clostridium sp.]|nr:FliM/FliN family flagellar motor switch protein [Clostridium sp.]
MLIREESENITSEFSSRLKLTYNWFNGNFTKILHDTFIEFWGNDAEIKLVSVSENTNILSSNEEFFVTQIRLNKELSVFIRLSKQIVKSLLEGILGSNEKNFNIEKITELEAKILTGFDDFLYKNFSHLIKTANNLPKNNTNYNECNLTFFVKEGIKTLGKIVIKIPVVAITPENIALGEETFNITNFLSSTAEVNLSVGTTRLRLNDVKNLEKDDIVLLENSSAAKMILKYGNYCCDVRIAPNPAIMIDYDNFDENGGKSMTGPDIYNMWDTIQVEIGAEFEKVKLTLGELKQISEGLVVDIGSVYDNKIDLKVEDKIVASGELVIINDRYGVKINEIFTEEKQEASDNAQYAQEYDDIAEEDTNEIEDFEEDNTLPQQEDEDEEFKEEDFDYSDFDVDEEDI